MIAARLLPPEPVAFEGMTFERAGFKRDIAPTLHDLQDRVAVNANADAGGVRRLGRSRVERLVRTKLGGALAELRWTGREGVDEAIAAALAARPGVLAVLGGDGTVRSALDAAQGRTPVAPLPGGTLNRLSRAVFGRRSLRACLGAIPRGAAQTLPAGRIGGHRFYVVSGFGPAMELDAVREDLRSGGLTAAWLRLSSARDRPFGPAIRWWSGGEPQTASALVAALGPIDAAFGLARRAPRTELEGAGTLLHGWPDLAGVAAHALAGRWRTRRGLAVQRGASLEVEGLEGPVFGLLDGERRLLPQRFTLTFEPAAALAWGPAQRSRTSSTISEGDA